MDAAVSALIGAGVGAIIPSAERIYTVIRARGDAREGRLFDHKRQAFAAYLAKLRTDLDYAWSFHNEDAGALGAEAPLTATDALGERRAEVLLYCTTTTETLADAAFKAVSTYIHGGEVDQYQAADAAINAFAKGAGQELRTGGGNVPRQLGDLWT